MINRIRMILVAVAACFLCGCGGREEAILMDAAQESRLEGGAQPAAEASIGDDGALRLQPGTDIAGQTETLAEGEAEQDDRLAGDTQSVTAPEIVVHVCGAVMAPGVYTLGAECRIWDAVEAAGGFSEEASTDYLNLAGMVSDGQKVYVPTAEEAKSLPASDAGLLTENPTEAAAEKNRKVNLNTADASDLTELPGIGEAKAKSILAYRTEHGRFSSIEEIMEIPGIKEAVFSKIKDYITVD